MEKGLAETSDFWEPIRAGYVWVHQAAHLLNNAQGLDVLVLRCQYRQLLTTMGNFLDHEGVLGRAATQFRKVSKSYWRCLFTCYSHADLPRTNNALEQQFGSYRHHERRCSGRKTASAMTVLRGSVRVVAALSTPERAYEGVELRPHSLTAWKALRKDLQSGHGERAQQRRFRKDPQAYLTALEERLVKAVLPT